MKDQIKSTLIALNVLHELISNMRYAQKKDNEFPSEQDFLDLEKLKENIVILERLLYAAAAN